MPSGFVIFSKLFGYLWIKSYLCGLKRNSLLYKLFLKYEQRT